LRAANRRKYRELASRHGVPVVAIAFDMSPRTFQERNRGRLDRVVDEDVVERQVEQMAETMAVLPSDGYAALYVLRDGDDVELTRSSSSP
jgi:predicted kinase